MECHHPTNKVKKYDYTSEWYEWDKSPSVINIDHKCKNRESWLIVQFFRKLKIKKIIYIIANILLFTAVIIFIRSL